ncbi:hypothetical protein Asulf_01720 [Archaeoglobus sulfaticallidus PM70-1]|uniref:Vitamin K epoxide reductase domain-containing protein n=1 Tax=Archaeoglobus sulfaticallidus PM70-1 TaxID=387631 RepID=N0BM60_9EURY|nr:hypothetical protein [Archaeoglobus sulfaticallidus]AGK61691.1 hypothetical protein Asulf_01720 [Archaeoglobus sulfaticallidus PM70-1]
MNKLKLMLISLGLLDSGYLLISTYTPDFCPTSGCSTNLTMYGLNIPALFGLMWFLLYGFLKGKMLSIWKILGVAGIGSLGSYAILNSYFCPYCFFAYFLGLSLIVSDYLGGN